MEIEITDPQHNTIYKQIILTHSGTEIEIYEKRNEAKSPNRNRKKKAKQRTQLNSAKMNRIESSTATGLGLLAALCCQFGLISVSWRLTAGVCQPSERLTALLATQQHSGP